MASNGARCGAGALRCAFVVLALRNVHGLCTYCVYFVDVHMHVVSTRIERKACSTHVHFERWQL